MTRFKVGPWRIGTLRREPTGIPSGEWKSLHLIVSRATDGTAMVTLLNLSGYGRRLPSSRVPGLWMELGPSNPAISPEYQVLSQAVDALYESSSP